MKIFKSELGNEKFNLIGDDKILNYFIFFFFAICSVLLSNKKKYSKSSSFCARAIAGKRWPPVPPATKKTFLRIFTFFSKQQHKSDYYRT